MVFPKIQTLHRNNVATFRRSPLAEISGSLGDLGTLLPLMIALAINNSISLSTTLVFSGLWNIVTGVFFGIPLPVQPMKVCFPSLASTRILISADYLGHCCSCHFKEIHSRRDHLRWLHHLGGSSYLQCYRIAEVVFKSNTYSCRQGHSSWCRPVFGCISRI